MILSGKEIMKQREEGKIVIDPFDEKQVNPNSYNLRLGNKVFGYDRTFDDSSIYDEAEPDFEWNMKNEGSVYLIPGQFYLAETLEHTETHGFVPMLEGRSSIGRQGLFIHVTAGFGDVGFCGRWTLELYPVVPVRVWYGMEIGQIFYHTIMGDFEEYSGRYQGALGVETVKGGGR